MPEGALKQVDWVKYLNGAYIDLSAYLTKENAEKIYVTKDVAAGFVNRQQMVSAIQSFLDGIDFTTKLNPLIINNMVDPNQWATIDYVNDKFKKLTDYVDLGNNNLLGKANEIQDKLTNMKNELDPKLEGINNSVNRLIRKTNNIPENGFNPDELYKRSEFNQWKDTVYNKDQIDAKLLQIVDPNANINLDGYETIENATNKRTELSNKLEQAIRDITGLTHRLDNDYTNNEKLKNDFANKNDITGTTNNLRDAVHNLQRDFMLFKSKDGAMTIIDARKEFISKEQAGDYFITKANGYNKEEANRQFLSKQENDLYNFKKSEVGNLKAEILEDAKQLDNAVKDELNNKITALEGRLENLSIPNPPGNSGSPGGNLTPPDLSSYLKIVDANTKFYTKQEIDNKLKNINQNSGSGNASPGTPGQPIDTTEIDNKIEAIKNKVEAIDTEYKAEDTKVKEKIDGVDNKVDTLQNEFNTYKQQNPIPDAYTKIESDGKYATKENLEAINNKFSDGTVLTQETLDNKSNELKNELKGEIKSEISKSLSGSVKDTIVEIATPLVSEAIDTTLIQKIEPAVNSVIDSKLEINKNLTLKEAQEETKKTLTEELKKFRPDLGFNIGDYALSSDVNVEIGNIKKRLPSTGEILSTTEAEETYLKKEALEASVTEKITEGIASAGLVKKEYIDKKLEGYITAEEAATKISEEVINKTFTKDTIVEAIGNVIQTQNIPIEIEMPNIEGLGFVHNTTFEKAIEDLNKKVVDTTATIKDGALAALKDKLVNDNYLTTERMNNYILKTELPGLVKTEVQGLRDAVDTSTHYTKQEIDDQIHILKRTLKEDLLKDHSFEITLPTTALGNYADKFELGALETKMREINNTFTNLGLDQVDASFKNHLITDLDLTRKVNEVIDSKVSGVIEADLNAKVTKLKQEVKVAVAKELETDYTNKINNNNLTLQNKLDGIINTAIVDRIETLKQDIKNEYNGIVQQAIDNMKDQVLAGIASLGIKRLTPVMIETAEIFRERKPSYYKNLGAGVHLEYVKYMSYTGASLPYGQEYQTGKLVTTVFLTSDTTAHIFQELEWYDTTDTGSIGIRKRVSASNNDNWTEWRQ